MVSIIGAVLLFGVIVLIHEFGHFLLAKLNGIGVLEFSIGMGPRLWSVQKGETRYSLKALPFGGSCMMLGEDEQETDDRAFNNKSVWARIQVIAAGPVFNFVLAFVCAVIVVMQVGIDLPQIKGVTDGFPAKEAGLLPGDMITAINGKKVTTYRDVRLYLDTHPGAPLNVAVERTAANGAAEKKQISIIPKYSKEHGGYMMGLEFDPYRQPVQSAGGILRYGVYEVGYVISSTFQSLGMLFRHEAPVEDMVAGPVRIVTMVGDTIEDQSQYGIGQVVLLILNWCLLLSASLGIMNLLPIPALDGGRLVFLIIEGLRGKPVDREKEGMVHMVGMMFLMALMVFVLFTDIRSFF